MVFPFLPRIIKILMGGGEISVARILRRPFTMAGKIKRITGMLGTLSPSELDQIIDVAERGISSGRNVTQGIQDGVINVGGIYEQPYLFGDTPGGRRGFAELDVFDPNIGHKVRVSVDWSDPNELLNLKQIATDELQSRIDRSPEAFGVHEGYKVNPSTVVVTFAERRF